MPKTSGSFQKGHKGLKPKGAISKVTREFKEAVTEFITLNHDRFGEWLEQIDDPKDRFDVVCKLAEYAYPKLARQEVSGPDGAPLLQSDQVDVEELANAVRAIIRQTKH